MSEIIVPRRHIAQPQGQIALAPAWQDLELGWLHYAPMGRSATIGDAARLPSSRVISPCAAGLGYRYVTNGGGDEITLPAFGSTNLATFFFAVVLNSGVAWAPPFYDRGGVNGPAFGTGGTAFRYIWDGSEWNYETGLTATVGALTVGAYTIRPGRVDIALNGQTHTRAVTNSARSFLSVRMGQDIQDTGRTLDGHVLMAGIVTGAAAWSLERLRAFTESPWQLFRADPLRIYSLPTGPISWSSLTASNITASGATLTLGGITR